MARDVAEARDAVAPRAVHLPKQTLERTVAGTAARAATRQRVRTDDAKRTNALDGLGVGTRGVADGVAARDAKTLAAKQLLVGDDDARFFFAAAGTAAGTAGDAAGGGAAVRTGAAAAAVAAAVGGVQAPNCPDAPASLAVRIWASIMESMGISCCPNGVFMTSFGRSTMCRGIPSPTRNCATSSEKLLQL